MNTKLKTYIIVGLVLVLGIFLGATLFTSEPQKEEHHHSQEQAETSVWTCSMHPQIRSEEPGDCPICGMELIPANQMDEGIDPDAIQMSKTARKLAQVETMTVGSQDLASNLNFSGRLEINQDETQSIASNFKARIEKWYVNEEGEKVTQGQVIAELYAPEIQVLKEELELATRQKNEMLLKSIQQKIENYELSMADVKSLNNGRLKLKSPKTGVISSLKVKQGDNVNAGQNLMNIANLSTLWAIIDVYESDLNKIKVGDKLNLKTLNDEEISGEVTFISPVLDANSRSAKARVVVDNSKHNLKPGVFLTAEMSSSTSKQASNQALMVPKSAVLWTGKRSVVYQQLENENGVFFKMKIVKTGSSSTDYIEILSGLEAGDEIVTQGAFSIDSEAQLAGKTSMMNPKEEEEQKEPIAWEELKLEAKKFKKILETYLDLKGALSEDNEGKSFEIAKDFQQQLKLLENTKAKEGLQDLIVNLVNSKSIEDARQHFLPLSDAMIALAQNNNPLDETLYVQFCPMANNDQGAFWLSTETEIKNPYFGSMMLRCGNVEGEIE